MLLLSEYLKFNQILEMAVDLLLFFKAALIGLSIAAPVGPVGLLCMRRTLSGGPRSGLATGLGAACADALYGAIGAFGLTALTRFFTSLTQPLALLGGLFLIGMGLRLLRHGAMPETVTGSSTSGMLRSFASALLLTLANPMTIVSFIAVFSALSGALRLTPESALTMVSGVFLGSALWWLLLSASVALIRHWISSRVMLWINQAAATLLLGFGGWQICTLWL